MVKSGSPRLRITKSDWLEKKSRPHKVSGQFVWLYRASFMRMYVSWKLICRPSSQRWNTVKSSNGFKPNRRHGSLKFFLKMSKNRCARSLKKDFNSVISFRRGTHFRLCLLETQVLHRSRDALSSVCGIFCVYNWKED